MILKSTGFKHFAKIMGGNYGGFFVQVVLALTLQATLNQICMWRGAGNFTPY